MNDESYKIRVGDNLKELRKKNGLSQEEISKILGINRSTYSNYENNIRTPNLDVLKNIADKLNVRIEFLIKGNVPMTDKDMLVYLVNNGHTIESIAEAIDQTTDTLSEIIFSSKHDYDASNYSLTDTLRKTFDIPKLDVENELAYNTVFAQKVLTDSTEGIIKTLRKFGGELNELVKDKDFHKRKVMYDMLVAYNIIGDYDISLNEIIQIEDQLIPYIKFIVNNILKEDINK